MKKLGVRAVYILETQYKVNSLPDVIGGQQGLSTRLIYSF